MDDFNPIIREQSLNFSTSQLKIKCPSKTMVFGPTGSGKTTMVLKLLKNHYFAQEFSKIVLCIPRMSINQMDKTVQEYKNATNNSIQVYEGLLVPKASDFEEEGEKLIIYEDLYEDLSDNLSMSKFFTFLSRFYLLN